MCDKKSRVLSEVELRRILASREDVVCVFDNETQDYRWGAVECKVIEHDNGITFAVSGHHHPFRLYNSLEEAVLREVVEHGLKVLCVNTSHASKMKYVANEHIYSTCAEKKQSSSVVAMNRHQNFM